MGKIKQNYMILAIDTSCDETAAAIVMERKIISNVILSQIEVHKPWGGVVPNLARQEHQKHISQVIDLAIKRADSLRKKFKLGKKVSWQNIDAIAVTQGPGLAIALEVGLNKAKELAKKYHKPIISVNHMEGHLLAFLGLNAKGNGPLAKTKILFPSLGLLVSGGHTQLVLVKNIGDYQLLGETLDDAAGEAFDKVAKMLNLGYPGGPIIEELARTGDPLVFDLPIPMIYKPSLNFSFSGLKTACLYKLRSIQEKKKNKQFYADFSASFQRVLTKSIIIKLKKAIKMNFPRQLFLGGGVINNLYLRNEIRKLAYKWQIPVFIPYSKNLISDNAAMIGIAAWYQAQKRQFVKNIDVLDRQPNLSI